MPSSLNYWTRAHWRVRDRERKQWADKIVPALFTHGLRVNKPKFTCKVALSLCYYFSNKSRRKRPDLDNLAPKHIIDALRGYVFPDDGPAYIVSLTQTVRWHGGADFTALWVGETGA